MGKEKLYVGAREWRQGPGGKRADKVVEGQVLPFDHCALTYSPFTTPVLAVLSAAPRSALGGLRKGAVFEFSAILPAISKTGTNPVSDEPLRKEDLISLHFAKNNQGQYHCPVTFKVFNHGSQIVAIKETGNVFAFDAVQNLCIKPGTWVDPLNEEPFAGPDSIIDIHDPTARFSATATPALAQAAASAADVPAKKKQQRSNSGTGATGNVRLTGIAARILEKAAEETRKREALADPTGANKKKKQKLSATGVTSQFSSGMCAASLTSSAFTPTTDNSRAEADPLEVREQRWAKLRRLKKKAYARLQTNMGDLNLELHAEYCPATCENFLRLCEAGYYDSLSFHRLIKGFMIQGGDPTATGRGGKSVYGAPFKDEVQTGNVHLKHSARGILSMANSGPNTNGSQFFITFGPKPNLDGKHTVFGRIVGGLEALDKIEAVATDAKDKPLKPITIQRAVVFVNPLKDVAAQEEKHAAPAPAPVPAPSSLVSAPAPALQRRTKKSSAAPAVTSFDNFDAW